MHLLELKGNGEVSLTADIIDNIPPYAILSHTWGADSDEVTFQDLTLDVGQNKPGYEKIRFCEKQATKDRLRYVWVDTCCIDKSNSAELNEAINSMFRWYHEAAVCYVYLSDVSTPEVSPQDYDQDGHIPDSMWVSAFRNSRWFTRGWTLQELIAPQSVEFFSRRGDQLGDKKSLGPLLYEITRIPINALQGSPMSEFSVQERFSWAANRDTKRKEDLAYSLLGLFDIHMPLIYGEGKYKAMRRLHKEIDKLSRNVQLGDLPNPQAVPKATWIVPFEKNHRFTGRGSQLAQLEAMLFTEDRTTKIAIMGLGGVGKTQLMLELLYRTRKRLEDCSIIWIPAINMESVQQAYLSFAQHLKLPGCEEDKADVKRLVQGYLSKESAGRWLLVFDNADDINMWIQSPRDNDESGRLSDYLPKSRHGSIIFTTRYKKVAVKLAHQNIVEVLKMDEDVATQLLRNYLVDKDLMHDDEDMKTLLAQLVYLPLAIVQAAAYINENSISISEYLMLLNDQEEEVIDLLSKEFEDEGRYRNVNNQVATTWLISFKQIQKSNSLAADFLSFIACIDPKDVPLSLLPPGQSRRQEMEAIGMLEAYSFITRQTADASISVHRLVHLATRNWLREEDVLAEWAEKAVARLKDAFPCDRHENRVIWRTYLAHAGYALQSNLIDPDGKARIGLMNSLARCLDADGRYREAEILHAEVVEHCKRVLGLEHSDTLSYMANYAATLGNLGRYPEAEKLQRQVLPLIEKLWGKEHPVTLAVVNNLALDLKQQDKFDEAEVLYRQTFELSKKALGNEHRDTLNSAHNLAALLVEQKKYDKAEPLLKQTLDLKQEVLGKEHLDTLNTMSYLTKLLGGQGNLNEAELNFREILLLRERVLGQEHPDTLIGRHNLAHLLGRQGKFDEAKTIYRDTLQLREKVLGKEHPKTPSTMYNFALLLYEQGRFDEAETIYRDTLQLHEKVLGKEHPRTLSTMHNFALLLYKQGKFDEAETIYRDTLQLREKVLGKEHPHTLSTMNDFASSLYKQGRFDEAETIYRDTLQLREKVLGKEHPDTHNTLCFLALVLSEQGNSLEAITLFQRDLKLRETLYGPDDAETLARRRNLSELRQDQATIPHEEPEMTGREKMKSKNK